MTRTTKTAVLIIVLSTLLVASTLSTAVAAAEAGPVRRREGPGDMAEPGRAPEGRFPSPPPRPALCDVEKDLVIWQGLGEPQRDGSTLYRVDVTNQCSGDGRPCAISRIYLRCGNFRSLVPVDPGLLRVVRPGVCLLNGGRTVGQNGNVSFVYASYASQKLYVLSARCQ